MEINQDNKDIILNIIKNLTENHEFKDKIKYFRKNKIKKLDIHKYFLENDDKFYYYYTDRCGDYLIIDSIFMEYYSNNIEKFKELIDEWKLYIETMYNYHNTSYCIIL